MVRPKSRGRVGHLNPKQKQTLNIAKLGTRHAVIQKHSSKIWHVQVGGVPKLFVVHAACWHCVHGAACKMLSTRNTSFPRTRCNAFRNKKNTWCQHMGMRKRIFQPHWNIDRCFSNHQTRDCLQPFLTCKHFRVKHAVNGWFPAVWVPGKRRLCRWGRMFMEAILSITC